MAGLGRLALAYAEQELAAGPREARMAVAEDLERIRASLLGLVHRFLNSCPI
jgi:hypothetical protein